MNALQRLPILVLAGFAACWLPVSAPAFSSAENASHHQPAQHLGYVAFAAEGKLEALMAVPRPENAEARLSKAGIEGLQTFSASVDGRTVLFSRHTLPNGACVSNAWSKAMADETLGPWFKEQGTSVEAHPRAAAMGMDWLPMEQVFYHAGPERKPGKEARACAAITGLKPEMEMQYRTLHQTGWPGMLAAMDRANVNHFTLYLVDIGDKLYLFYYFDYAGDDFAADMAGMAKDPVTQRWWKHTDPCQIPLPGAKGIWTDMVPVGAPAKVDAPAKAK
jgi:L-rhamnose mutarotase